jgi:hypothetical protein
MKVGLQWVKANSVLLINAGSLIGTIGVTSVLGFVYWWLAARQFSAEGVGLARAAAHAGNTRRSARRQHTPQRAPATAASKRGRRASQQ